MVFLISKAKVYSFLIIFFSLLSNRIVFFCLKQAEVSELTAYRCLAFKRSHTMKSTDNDQLGQIL